MRTAIAFTLGFLLALTLAARQPKQNKSYAQGCNNALNMTLLVGSEWREQHKTFQWKTLQDEVCRRMGVKRVEPWSKSQ